MLTPTNPEPLLSSFDGLPLEPSPGPFGREAINMIRNNLAVLPCGGEDGKLPLVRWKFFKRPQSRRVIEKYLTNADFRAANVGIITGPSQLTVIDCDTPGKLDELTSIFGETPIIVGTPRGGLHLYFRSSNEPCSAHEYEGLKIDVKGVGGFVIAPPSQRLFPDGRTGCYSFVEGGWEWLEELSPIKPGAIANISKNGRVNLNASDSHTVPVGQRNATLFGSLIKCHHASKLDVLKSARELTTSFAEPLTDKEVTKTANSVWGYIERGEQYTPTRRCILTPIPAFDLLLSLKNGAEGNLLLALLLKSHGARAKRGETFAIAPAAMAQSGLVFDWGVKRYRGAIEALLNAQILIRVHEGGKRLGDPHLYSFGPMIRN